MLLSRRSSGRTLLTGAIAIGFLLTVFMMTTAGDLSIHLEVGGGLDAWLAGLSFSAAIDGSVDLVGDVPCEDGVVWISATGSLVGIGCHSFLELMTTGWILITASGRTAEEEEVVFRSLLYASHHSLVPLQAGDSFEGVHHTVLQIGDAIAVYEGEVTGTVVGGLAPAGTEGTIRLAGSGNFILSGQRMPEANPNDFPLLIPLDDPNLTEAFLQTLDAFFDLPNPLEPVSASRDP